MALRQLVRPPVVPIGPTPEESVAIGWGESNATSRSFRACATNVAWVYRTVDTRIWIDAGARASPDTDLSALLGGARPLDSRAAEGRPDEAALVTPPDELSRTRLLPRTPIRTTAAAAPASEKRSRRGRRRVARSGVTDAPEARTARWACSAARLALIRSTR